MYSFFKQLPLFLGLGLLLACSDAKETQSTLELEKLVTTAGQVQGEFYDKMDAWMRTASNDELTQSGPDSWYQKNVGQSALLYFDDFYSYAKEHLDDPSGFDALIMSLKVAPRDKSDYQIQRDIHELLYKYYLNTPEYAYVLLNIGRGISAGHPGSINDQDAWNAPIAIKERHARTVMLLDRAAKNAVNPVVKNHAMLILAEMLSRYINTIDDVPLAKIAPMNARIETLLTQVIASTKKHPMTKISSDEVKVLITYNKSMEAAKNKPKNNRGATAQERLDMGEIAQKLLFSVSHLSVGRMLPPTTEIDLQGNPQELAQYKGRVLLIDFWATWCGPCIAKMPHLREIEQQYADRPFEILGISGDDTIEDVTDFLKDNDLPWDLWFTGASDRLIKTWSITGLPTVFLVDHTGRIVAKNPSDEEINTLLVSLVAAAETAAQ